MDFKNKVAHHWRKFTKSFVYAWEGIKYAVFHERNLKIQFFIGIVVMIAAILLNVPKLEKLILLIIIGNVISLEIINTALERVVNLMTKEYDPIAKVAKDLSAGAVLIFSMFAVMIGIIIFCEPIVTLFR